MRQGEALDQVAAHAFQDGQVIGRFGAVGRHLHFQRVAQIHNRLYCGAGLLIVHDAGDQSAIDLDAFKRSSLELHDIGIPPAVIVNVDGLGTWGRAKLINCNVTN